MATIESQHLSSEPVPPSEAQAAQIPLQTFTIPTFPPEASALKALTLTSDITASEYQDLITQPFSIHDTLPQSIESLTLELFVMGYPPDFLSTLAKCLPNLKSLVIYSQLFAGTTEASQADAVQFFKLLPNLRALHLLDVFAQPHFFEKAAPWLRYNTSDNVGEARRGLMFLEMNYTFRHEDEEFMSKVQAPELPLLVGPGLISCSFNLASPESSEEDPDDPATVQGAGNKEGIMAFNKTLAEPLIDALTNEDTAPKGLRALNMTLYTLTTSQLRKILKKQNHVMVLNATVEIEPGESCKNALLECLEECKDLEQVDIIANPTLQFFVEVQNPRSGTMAKTFPSAEDLDALSKKCNKLSSFKANVLRTTSLGTVDWEKKAGEWNGGVTLPQGSGTVAL